MIGAKDFGSVLLMKLLSSVAPFTCSHPSPTFAAMKLEHFALNVQDPNAMTDWYCKHLGLTIVSQKAVHPFTVFLADDSGKIMIEVYNNPPDAVPVYKDMNPLQVHIAFVSEDPAADRDRLVNAGAQLVSDDLLEDGSHLVMLRDPWGLALQLCKRGKPMLR